MSYMADVISLQNKLKSFENMGGIIRVEDRKVLFFFKKTVWTLIYNDQTFGPWDGQTFIDPSFRVHIVAWIDKVSGGVK